MDHPLHAAQLVLLITVRYVIDQANFTFTFYETGRRKKVTTTCIHSRKRGQSTSYLIQVSGVSAQPNLAMLRIFGRTGLCKFRAPHHER